MVKEPRRFSRLSFEARANATPPIPNPVTVELLDPYGHSQILHEDATMDEIPEDVLQKLPIGPEPAVFEKEVLIRDNKNANRYGAIRID